MNSIDKYFENEEPGIWEEPKKKSIDIKAEITVEEEPIDLRISNEISVPANQVTVENVKYCLGDYQNLQTSYTKLHLTQI